MQQSWHSGPGRGAAPGRVQSGAGLFMLAFVCPHCGIRLQVDDRWAGKPIRCGGCRGVVVTTAGAPAPPSDSRPQAASLDVPTVLPPLPSGSAVGREPVAAAPGRRPTVGPDEDLDLGAILAPALAADELGRLGPYRVLEVLGAGGMGIVFRAEDVQLRRLVALKVMRPALAANSANRQRFLREAQAAARIEHDHVVTIYLVGEDRGIPYLAMQLLQGETLEDRLRREKRLAVPEVLRLAHQAASALAVAHERGLVHRDIKPGNIWLETPTTGHQPPGTTRVKILDFGLARSICEDTRLTQSGALIGSPGYMSPEQVRGGPPEPRSDLFGLGCVLYRCCTGRLPFQGPDALAILAALATETPPPVRALNPEVSPALSALVMRLLARDPAGRPASAAAVAAALSNQMQSTQVAMPGDRARAFSPGQSNFGGVPSGDAPLAFDTLPLPAPRETATLVPQSIPRKSAPRRRLPPAWVLAAAAGGLCLGVALLVGGIAVLSRKSQPTLPQPAPPRPVVEEPFAAIEAAVQARMFKGTVPGVGVFAREPFEYVPPEGALLIGFEAGLGKFATFDIIDYLRPIYLTARGEKFGRPIGQPTPRIETVKAKPGYAVGAIAVQGRGVLDGFSLTFRKIGKYGLKRQGEYRSNWLPGRLSGRGEVVDGDGAFVIGVCGRALGDGKPGSVGPVLFRRDPD